MKRAIFFPTKVLRTSLSLFFAFALLFLCYSCQSEGSGGNSNEGQSNLNSSEYVNEARTSALRLTRGPERRGLLVRLEYCETACRVYPRPGTPERFEHPSSRGPPKKTRLRQGMQACTRRRRFEGGRDEKNFRESGSTEISC